MLVNTRYFKETGNYFLKNGVYTDAPYGSRDYNDFWDEEEKRCFEGYKVGDLWIPGKYYRYLNFFPIMKTIKQGIGNRTAVKKMSLPDFWEIQLEWFTAKHIAWNGATFNEKTGKYSSVVGTNKDGMPLLDGKKVDLYPLKYNKLLKRDYLGGEHIICAKTRGCGFSYMDASEGEWYFNLIPDSKSFYLAFDEKYLLGNDGILLKCWEALNHINLNTDWSKKRQGKDTNLIKKASFIYEGDPLKIEHGFKSQIGGITCDEPIKAKGGRGIKITLEEFGAFPSAYQTLHEVKAVIQDGSMTFGQISAFGTGNSEDDELKNDKNLATLDYLFNNPAGEGFMEFINGWEEGVQDTCGYFVPIYLADNNYIDEEGNALTEYSIPVWDEKYEKAKSNPNPSALSSLTAQYPKVPSHIFNKNTGNPLPSQLAKNRISQINGSRVIQGNIMHGMLHNEGRGVEFRPDDKVKPLNYYPHKNDENLDGCVTIFHLPFKNKEGNIPSNLYFITVDPYKIDGATDKTSLWCATVWQRDNNFTEIRGNRQVAKYVARPASLNTCYVTTDLLSTFYGNCEIQAEIDGGGTGLFDWLKANKKLHKASREVLFDVARDTKGVNAKYFMAMPTTRKTQGLSYYATWLTEPAFLDSEGNEIFNIQLYDDVGELEEITKFSTIAGRNFDRISSSILAMFMFKEKADQEIKAVSQKSDFYSRPLFADSGEENNTGFLTKF